MNVILILLNRRTHFSLSQPINLGGQLFDAILCVIHIDLNWTVITKQILLFSQSAENDN